jgi:predicted heme/steroid binding protein
MQNNDCGGRSSGRFMTKINRISAWVLLAAMLLYFISGYGMTRGIIDSAVATRLHVTILPPFVIISFVVHSFLSIRLAFIRWKIWNRIALTAVLLLFAVFSISIIYIEMFDTSAQVVSDDQPIIAGEAIAQLAAPTASSVAAITSSTPAAIDTKQKVFNAAELAKYNGKNGMPAYVAVDGLVYDMSRVFRQGTHFEHIAGTELTQAFYSFHVKAEITKYPVVGIFRP